MIVTKIPHPYGTINVFNRKGSPTDSAIIKEIFSENVYHVSNHMLGDRPVVLDVGANIGVFTLDILSRMRSEGKPGTVIAIEPEPNNLEVLLKNINENQEILWESTVLVVPCALGKKEGSVKIENRHGSSRISEEGSTVKMKTLESILRENKIEKIDIAKFDIEGYESEVINSLSKSTLNNMHHMMIEFDEDASRKDFLSIVDKIMDTSSFSTLGVPSRGCYIYTENHLWQN